SRVIVKLRQQFTLQLLSRGGIRRSMENDGVVSPSADPSPSLGEVPAVVEETIGGSDEQEDPAAAASAVVDEEGDDGPAAAE
ncbi:unnamed protein product, partial [Ectocarpus sp. 12 AP-2014]